MHACSRSQTLHGQSELLYCRKVEELTRVSHFKAVPEFHDVVHSCLPASMKQPALLYGGLMLQSKCSLSGSQSLSVSVLKKHFLQCNKEQGKHIGPRALLTFRP